MAKQNEIMRCGICGSQRIAPSEVEHMYTLSDDAGDERLYSVHTAVLECLDCGGMLALWSGIEELISLLPGDDAPPATGRGALS